MTDNEIKTIELLRDHDVNCNKFLTFRIDDEVYGVEILKVREIIGIIGVTPLPQTPDYVKGVINLRGKIIPVIELRSVFSMKSEEYTEQTCVIVVEISNSEDRDQMDMGVIVDSVSEVLDIAPTQIEPAPQIGCSINTDYILGMGKVSHGDLENVFILLDIDKVLSTDNIQSLLSTAQVECESVTIETTNDMQSELLN